MRLWESGKTTWSELERLSIDDVMMMNDVVDAIDAARAEGRAREDARHRNR